ncbi:hypothetical protein COCMIDRAFT_41911 [Bipolaris oryzae ATCC 44560]|uniref:Uncharacterized protein n=1 Tax=Bipolaris oryzae ATCC 44560 TaxID=930090 RepID=W6YJN5_COCMI|nr:uncharacterized protein COCMIDRAFT_41911 [Bipolaris oryzae ATCC 44560]EUC39577.1 hypothetical protein COCMIDRAFT_41911 [Bipolaris oryzae ATCC 44560]
MSSQDTIPDNTFYQGHQNCLLVRNDVVDPASDLAETATTSKQSGDEKSKEQPSEFTSRKIKEAVSHNNASKFFIPITRAVFKNYVERKHEESDTEGVYPLGELKDIAGQLEHALSRVKALVSHFQEAPEQHTHKTLHMSGKLVRWADSTSTHAVTRRPRKKARRNL